MEHYQRTVLSKQRKNRNSWCKRFYEESNLSNIRVLTVEIYSNEQSYFRMVWSSCVWQCVGCTGVLDDLAENVIFEISCFKAPRNKNYRRYSSAVNRKIFTSTYASCMYSCWNNEAALSIALAMPKTLCAKLPGNHSLNQFPCACNEIVE